jgi:DNA-damage-inducible protein J
MSTTDTKINVRIDRVTKEQAQATLEALGLDISSGIKLFLRSVINTQSIPFEVRTKNGYTLREEKEITDSLATAKKEIRKGTAKVYASAQDMITDMTNWDDEGEYIRN